MQHRCRIEVVEKYTSKLFHRSQTNVPNSHFPANSTDALNDIAHKATNMSAIWNENVQTHTNLLEYLDFECCFWMASIYKIYLPRAKPQSSLLSLCHWLDVKAFESILKSSCPMTATASATTISSSSVSEMKSQWK